jgi:hypothetical protein
MPESLAGRACLTQEGRLYPHGGGEFSDVCFPPERDAGWRCAVNKPLKVLPRTGWLPHHGVWLFQASAGCAGRLQPCTGQSFPCTPRSSIHNPQDTFPRQACRGAHWPLTATATAQDSARRRIAVRTPHGTAEERALQRVAGVREEYSLWCVLQPRLPWELWEWAVAKLRSPLLEGGGFGPGC